MDINWKNILQSGYTDSWEKKDCPVMQNILNITLQKKQTLKLF